MAIFKKVLILSIIAVAMVASSRFENIKKDTSINKLQSQIHLEINNTLTPLHCGTGGDG
ncbi:hypothetical protein NF27_DT00130 [Candidatus Jidaibacter acanthamoeba]|uniref:Secreted protein n=1 Tax=Candidatus Jidaibacter acanthamoebae TaxID=86105 RepID=A0A0C1QIB4_9RICK|nr:hypothetical protein [Candidatus Jidaibacter acanthamoeba]KIE05239.1 hypothetical protein NF27_DT00130 [Candidatus Jidaibacter acanthamoeba]